MLFSSLFYASNRGVFSFSCCLLESLIPRCYQYSGIIEDASLVLWKQMQYYFRFCHWIHCKHSSDYFKASSFAWKKWLKVINVSFLRTFDDKFIGNVYMETAIIFVSKNHCHEKSEKHYWAQKSFAFTPESENGIKRQVNINIMCSRWISPHDHRRVRQDSEK